MTRELPPINQADAFAIEEAKREGRYDQIQKIRNEIPKPKKRVEQSPFETMRDDELAQRLSDAERQLDEVLKSEVPMDVPSITKAFDALKAELRSDSQVQDQDLPAQRRPPSKESLINLIKALKAEIDNRSVFD